VTLVVHLERGQVRGFAVEKGLVCLLNPKLVAEAAFERVLEVAIHKDQINSKARASCGSALRYGTEDCRSTFCQPRDSWT